MVTGQNLSLYLGDSFSQNLTAWSGSGVYFNLSGWTGEGGVKYRYGLTGYGLVFDFNNIAPESGLFNINCDYTQTTGIPVGEHHYNIKFSSGNTKETFYFGYMAVYPNVIAH